MIGELRQDVERLRRRDLASASILDGWLRLLENNYRDRLLPVDAGITDLWGRLNVPDPLPAVDGLMAATAIVRDFTFVTRNTQDVERTGVRLLNPFGA